MNKKGNRWKVLLLTALMLGMLWGVQVSVQAASGDNSLATLGILTEGVEISPEFYYSTIEYNVKVPAGTARLELDPVPSNSNASIVEITGQELVDGKTTVEILVEAENGSRYTYYLYVEADPSAAVIAETESEKETEPPTEKETEPETEDPRYVRVDRNSLQEAENTISALKSETSNYRDRLDILMKILYGMIGFCVILLFVVINLILKKKDLKSELQRYMGYGYPQEQTGAERPEEPYYEEYNNPYENNTESEYELQEEKTAKKDKKKRRSSDDPNTVPKPTKARKAEKPKPEYQKPAKPAVYQPNEQSTEQVEINMIDL